MKLPQIPKTLLIKKSPRAGMGIFTRKPFLPNEKIFEVTGKFIAGNADDEVSEETQSNAFRYDEDSYIDPGEKIGKYLNHSCAPNAFVAKEGKRLFVVAAKKIPSGREVLIDYSTILAADDIWTLKCNCKTSNCRKNIKRFNTLPKVTRELYMNRGMVPEYILNS